MSHPTSAEAPTGFHVLLQVLCLEQGISTPTMLAERLNLDPKLTQKWGNGKRTPGRSNEAAILRVLQPSSTPALRDWNRLIELARRRDLGGSTRDDGTAPLWTSPPVSEGNAGAVSAAPEPADLPAPGSAMPSFENGIGKNPAVETELSSPIDGEGISGRLAPEEGKAPSPTSDEVVPSVWQEAVTLAPALGRQPVLEDRAPAAPRRRQVAVWAGAAAVLIGAMGAMPYPFAGVDAGDRCDALAAAVWDAQKPAGLKGVKFSDIDTTAAMTACSEAVGNHDANPRYHFQLGRVFDRRKDYPRAFSEYMRATDKDSAYAPPFLNIGILYEHGQINGRTRIHQLSHRDLFTAAERYGQAAELDLPNGRYCYAISLLFNWNDHGPDSARAVDELRKARDGAVKRGVERDDALIRNIDELISDLQSPARRTMHVSCDPLRDIDLGPQIIPQ